MITWNKIIRFNTQWNRRDNQRSENKTKRNKNMKWENGKRKKKYFNRREHTKKRIIIIIILHSIQILWMRRQRRRYLFIGTRLVIVSICHKILHQILHDVQLFEHAIALIHTHTHKHSTLNTAKSEQIHQAVLYYLFACCVWVCVHEYATIHLVVLKKSEMLYILCIAP